ncbi:MAG: hypothetical protein EB117_16240 [Betaproteobacteria bacterium]|nr:hypothetical protein [Betaproteobacteria bacterium]
MAVYNDFGVPQLPPEYLPDQEVQGENGRLLRRALSQAGTLSNTVQPGQGSMLPNTLETLRGRAAGMYDRATQLMGQPLDYSGIQTFAKQRGQEGEQAMLNALAAQYAGEQFQPLQQQLMKTAAGSKEPIKMGGGMITGAGQFIKDPEAAQDKEVALLLNQAKYYEQMAQTAETITQIISATPPGKKPDAITQQSLVILLNKFLDPGSVVREGEFDRVVKAQGLEGRARNLADRILKGEPLDVNTINQINGLAQMYSQAATAKIQGIANNYADIANRRKLDLGSVISDPRFRGGSAPGASVVDFSSLPK